MNILKDACATPSRYAQVGIALGSSSLSQLRYDDIAASQRLSLPSDRSIEAAIAGVTADTPATNNRIVSLGY